MSALDWYESELVPGLLQTEDYARTLIHADNPGVDDAEIERRVHVRIARQALLTRVTAPPQSNVVLNESIVRRPIGGRNVMAHQLAQLVEMSELPNVSVRLMPFDAGLHYGVMSGPFVMMRFRSTVRAARPSRPPSTSTGSPERCTWTSPTRSTATTRRSRASGTRRSTSKPRVIASLRWQGS